MIYVSFNDQPPDFTGLRHCQHLQFLYGDDVVQCLGDGCLHIFIFFFIYSSFFLIFISRFIFFLSLSQYQGGYTVTELESSSQCPETHFACPDGLCLPVYLMCNGVSDCVGHVDERNCPHRSCPGYYRYRHSLCVCVSVCVCVCVCESVCVCVCVCGCVQSVLLVLFALHLILLNSFALGKKLHYINPKGKLLLLLLLLWQFV